MRPPLEHRGRNPLSNDFMYNQRVGHDQSTDFQFDGSQARGIARASSRGRALDQSTDFQFDASQPRGLARSRGRVALSSRPFTEQTTTYDSSSDQPFPNTEVVNTLNTPSQRGLPGGRRIAGYWGFSASSGHALTQQQTFIEEEPTEDHKTIQFASSQMGVYGQPPPSVAASQTLPSLNTCNANHETRSVLIDTARKMATLLTDLADKLDSLPK
ncbi:hypothetical protein Mgra_00000236 [Meloidogyne graminicola]|uniref:Uncharacterized protein n=1 Tax=Meloidogyne graminicola TaxID=189291 RepID=A0A8T0A528_9BILA|nr:hypothetical protein Mgra_00000236 [Meloidogyne graminicola]